MKNEIYKFNHFEIALTAFISNLENKIQQIIPNIPVLFMETGDETYWFKEKFENNENIKSMYQKVPRLVIDVSEIEIDSDQDTNQYVKIPYILNEKEYLVQSRRKAINFPFTCNLVCPNFLFGLSYLEILLSLLSIDNVFTYNFLGNNYPGSFNCQSFSLNKVPMENGGTKNFNINFTVNVQLQPQIIRYNTIQNISDDIDGRKTQINLITKDSFEDKRIDIINPEI